ncbi:MAG TPA: ABC transporter ATP-binding protein [Symbiobacteriaceae bacterium]|nr:ABC transporter ATP-binding protein [Symbiobacteriaceae bacterium]
MALLAAQGLVKRYGAFEAVKSISFEVQKGSCWGLLGPNGAGKSTTLGILSGTLEPTAGALRFEGEDWAAAEGARRRAIGYVPQELALYDSLSALENLRFWGRLYGVRGRALDGRIKEALDWVGLASRAREKVGAFSGGMKRRLNLAAAILHRPRLLLLDEPMVGVDPQSRNLLLEVLQHLRQEGMTLIYTSHYMAEVEAVCDRVAIIDHGKLLAEGGLSELLAQSGAGVLVQTSDAQAALAGDWGSLLPVAREEGLFFPAEQPGEILPQVVLQMNARGWQISGIEVVQPSLEAVFLALTGTALRDE